MNKKELIEKLKEHGAWCTECHDTNGEKDRYVKVAKVRELLEQLDEPQKVKVPAFVDEWIEMNKAGDVPIMFILKYFGEWFEMSENKELNDETCEWVIRNPEKFMRAWLDGYEVEEEPKYYVNIGDLYLKEPLGDTSDFTISMTWNREYAYPFDSWNMAREHASELGGAVEKV